MAQINVSTCVLSIVASFASGLDVFRRFRETRGKKKRSRSRSQRDASVDNEEVRLARSLRRGPEDIGREYQKSMHGMGEGFASGDVAAQTALAEILLKLNTGLVTIINTFLKRDKHEVQLDYRSLTSLSERTRIDTCRTLRHLYHRMTQFHIPAHILSGDHEQVHQSQGPQRVPAGKKTRDATSARHTKVRGPILARVVIADSAKPSQVALVRPCERKKKFPSSSSSMSSKTQSSASLLLPASSPAIANKIAQLPVRPINRRSQTVPMGAVAVQQHLASDMGDSQMRNRVAMQASRSTPRLPTSILEQESRSQMPNTAPLPAVEPGKRKATPIYYSIESASTKLGEIPMHKWAEPYDFELASRLNRQAERNGWPVTNLEDVQLNKKRGFFSFFRR